MRILAIISTFIIAIPLTAFSQSDQLPAEEKVQYQHDIGLNAIGIIRAAFDAEESDAITPYLFIYNWDLGKMNFRAGLGPQFSSSKEVHDGFTDSQEVTQLDIDARIGLGFDIIDGSKWIVRTGFDVVGGYSLDRTIDDTGFDRVTDATEGWNIGIGPFAQIIYRLSPRISLSTEASLYALHFNSTVREEFENFPDFNNLVSKTTGQRLDVFLPTSLFIHFHF